MKILGIGLIAWALWSIHNKHGLGLLPAFPSTGIVGGQPPMYQNPGLGQDTITVRISNEF